MEQANGLRLEAWNNSESFTSDDLLYQISLMVLANNGVRRNLPLIESLVSLSFLSFSFIFLP